MHKATDGSAVSLGSETERLNSTQLLKHREQEP